MDDLINSCDFSLRGYLPLIRKVSVTDMHGLAIYLKEGLPFAMDFNLKNSEGFLFVFLTRSTFVGVYFFLDEVLSIISSVNEFVFGDFNDHHKGWPTYSGGTDRLGELCYNFLI